MANLGQVIVGLLIIGIVACVDSAEEQVVTYVFGDSLTEVGNNNYLQSLAKSNFPFYGIDYEGGKATGRFTNGRTIGDIICNFYELCLVNLFIFYRFFRWHSDRSD